MSGPTHPTPGVMQSCTVTVAEHPRVTYMHDRRWGVGLDVRVPEGPVMIRTVPVQWLLEGHHGGHVSFDTSQVGTWVLEHPRCPAPP